MNKLLVKLSIVIVVTLLTFDSHSQIPNLKFPIPYGSNKAVGKYASVNGIKMYYEVYGEGKPLVLIHGNGGSILTMGYQVQYFSKYYRCIVADSRAHGKSGVGEGRLTYEQMADDWSALLDTLKIDSAYVLGCPIPQLCIHGYFLCWITRRRCLTVCLPGIRRISCCRYRRSSSTYYRINRILHLRSCIPYLVRALSWVQIRT